MAVAEINKARELSKRIRELEKKLASLRLTCDNIVPVLDGMPHSTDAKSKVEKLALQVLDGERELAILHDAFESERIRIANAIMMEYDDGVAQSLLLLRYVSCVSFREVARRMRYSLRHVFRLHDSLVGKMSYSETLRNATKREGTLDNTGQADIIRLE